MNCIKCLSLWTIPGGTTVITPSSREFSRYKSVKSISVYFRKEVVTVKSCDWKSKCNTDTEARFIHTLWHDFPFRSVDSSTLMLLTLFGASCARVESEAGGRLRVGLRRIRSSQLKMPAWQLPNQHRLSGIKVEAWEIPPFERETADNIFSAIQSKSSTQK